jgi:hypothetical protein
MGVAGPNAVLAVDPPAAAKAGIPVGNALYARDPHPARPPAESALPARGGKGYSAARTRGRSRAAIPRTPSTISFVASAA